jgi:hypothetical protein
MSSELEEVAKTLQLMVLARRRMAIMAAGPVVIAGMEHAK